MHESPIVGALVAKAEAIARDAGTPVRRVGINIGALSGVEEGAVRGYWRHMAGPLVADAALDFVIDGDPVAQGALGVTLAYVDVGEEAR
jgi:Zn finger protein HypA/HybF involved in hydrogenase expression